MLPLISFKDEGVSPLFSRSEIYSIYYYTRVKMVYILYTVTQMVHNHWRRWSCLAPSAYSVKPIKYEI